MLPFAGVQIFGIPAPILAAIFASSLLILPAANLQIRFPVLFFLACALNLTYLVSTLGQLNTDWFMFLKNAAYLFYFFILYNLLMLINKRDVVIFHKLSALGLLLFLAVFTLIAWRLGAIGALISLDYYRAVVPTLATINNAGAAADFTASDALRNTIAESVALTTFFAMVSRLFPLAVAGSALVFLFQSRRAFAAVMFLWITRLKSQYAVPLAAMGAVAGIILISFIDLSASRYADLDTGIRQDQLAQAIAMIAEQPLWGWGFGTKVYDLYVHNFFIASFLMSGFFAFALALLLVTFALIMAIKARVYGALIVFPITNMLLAATVEGTMSLAAWAALALISWENDTNGKSVRR